MFKKALLTTVTAGILAGSLAATATPAAATGSLYLSTPSLGLSFTTPRTLPRAKWVCEPVYGYEPYWTFTGVKYRLVKVDENCHWEWPRVRTMPTMPLRPFWPFGW